MKKILIMQAARFGDLVQTRRLLESARQRGEVHLAIDRGLADLARIIYPEARVHCLVFHSAPDPVLLEENESAFAELAAAGFDEVVNCNFSPLTGALCRLFDEDKIIGYRPARDSEGGLLRSPWTRLAFKISAMRGSSPLNLADFWAWFLNGPVAPEKVNPAASGKGGGLGVVIAGRESRRSLPPEALAQIAAITFNLLGRPEIRLFGTASEKPAARALARLLPPGAAGKCVDLCGRTNWEKLVQEVGALDLLITPDTGVMHLAAFLGTPTLAFFLSSALCHETGPYGAGHLIWQAAPECAPCLESAPCHRGVKCLEPFQERTFGRYLAAALEGGKMPPGLPVMLQLWKTGFDGLGARLELLAGVDGHAGARAIVRNLLGSRLGLPGFSDRLAGMPPYEAARLAGELFPEGEWMLPEPRYS